MDDHSDNFGGVKVALFFGDQLVVLLRDNKPGLQFANMWDFPGGGREGDETPFECLQREVQEEFGIVLTQENIVWQRKYPSMRSPGESYFCVAHISQELVDSIVFGDEGQAWRLMPVKEFLEREDAVPNLKIRLRDYLDSTTSLP